MMKAKKTLALVLATVTLLGIMTTTSFAATSSSASFGGSSSASFGGSSTPSPSPTAEATTITATIVNCNSWVSMRKSADSKSTRLAKLKKGVSVTVLETSGSYYKVSYDGEEGYVSKNYLALSSNTGSGSTGSTASGSTGVTTGNVNFRTRPSSSSSKVSGCSKVPKGSTVTILSYADGWYQVQYGSYTGYLSGSYVTVTSSTGGSTGSGDSTLSGVTPPTAGSSSSGSYSYTKSDVLGYGQTTTSTYIYSSSSTSSSRVATLASGRTVELLGTSSDKKYYAVRTGSYTGYVPVSALTIVSTRDGGGTSTRYAAYTNSSTDRWGTIKIDGTNINTYIYCNAINSKGEFYYNAYNSKTGVNYVYALSYYSDPIAVITGHNMRVSQTGFHALHHVQNAWLGKSKCDYSKRCSASCAGAKTNVFDINYNGSTKWQVVCFYEIDKSTVSSSTTRKNINTYNCFQSTLTGTAKQQWINTQLSYATSKYRGMALTSATSSDKLMLLMTCADSTGDSFSRLYFVLKAIN